MDHEHGAWSAITSITKLFFCGGYRSIKLEKCWEVMR